MLLLKTPSLTAVANAPHTELSSSLIVPAKSFTPSYSAKEDRIRVVINYSDYPQRVDFWITRSFFLKLLPSWEEYFYRYGLSDTPDATRAAGAAAIPSTSQTDRDILQLTEKEGVLLESVDMQFDRSKNRFKITLKGSNTEAFAHLSPQMMIGLLHSIFQSAPHLLWGISPALIGLG